MSSGGAQHYVLALGSSFAGFTINTKAAGDPNTAKNIFIDEGKTTAVTQVIADPKGTVEFYGDGDYLLQINDANGNVLYSWDNVKITSDTATLWEGNQGTSFPAAETKNRWQTFIKHTAGNRIDELGINDGTQFRTIIKKNSDDIHVFDDLITVNGPYIDVRAHGATGDGTTDDSAAVQTAINTLETAGGGILFFPPGIFLAENLDITAAGTREGFMVVGSGMISVIKAKGGAAIFSSIDMGGSNFQQFVMSNLQFDMNGKDVSAVVSTAAGQIAIYRDIWILDSTVAARSNPLIKQSATDHLTYFQTFNVIGNSQRGTAVEVEGNSVVFDGANIQNMNIAIDIASTRGTLSDLVIQNSRLDANDRAISAGAVAPLGLRITGNRFEDNVSYAIYLEGTNPTTSRVQSVSIRDNYIQGITATNHALFLKNIKEISIEDNSFDGTGGQIIDFSGGASVERINVKNNRVGTGGVASTMTASTGILPVNDITVDQKGIVSNNDIEVRTDTISISSAEMLALAATPKELVAAQGTKNLIEFVSATLFYNNVGVAYVEPSAPDDMAIEYDDGTGIAVTATIDATGFITVTNDEIRRVPTNVVLTDDLEAAQGKNLVLINTGGEYTTGNGTLKVSVSYRVISTGL